jgi:hypothetical protein
MFCKPCSGDLCEIHNFLFMQGLPLLLKRIRHFLNGILKSEKEMNAKVVVALYGDGTHDPKNIKQLLDPVMNGEFDLAIHLSGC